MHAVPDLVSPKNVPANIPAMTITRVSGKDNIADAGVADLLKSNDIIRTNICSLSK
jgi:hypothetical protein